MKPIREAPFTHSQRGESQETGTATPMADGLPADRTTCPWCLRQDQGCKKCGGTGMVCPVCRGSRVLRSDQGQRPLVIGCHGCTDWGNHSQHRWDDSGWPQFARDVRREAESIKRWKSAA